MIIREADSFGRGELPRKSVKAAYKIVAGLLLLGTTILLGACAEDSGWSASMSALPLNPGGNKGEAPQAPAGTEESPQ